VCSSDLKEKQADCKILTVRPNWVLEEKNISVGTE